MNTFMWILLFPAIAGMVYATFIIRDAAFRTMGKPVYNKVFFQIWLKHASIFRTPRRYRTHAIAFCVSLATIVLLIMNANF